MTEQRETRGLNTHWGDQGHKGTHLKTLKENKTKDTELNTTHTRRKTNSINQEVTKPGTTVDSTQCTGGQGKKRKELETKPRQKKSKGEK